MAYVFQNISDAARAEATGHGLHAAFKTLFHAVPVALALVSTSGQLFDSNERFHPFFGYAAEEIKAMPFASLVYPEDLPRTKLHFVDLVSGKKHSYQVHLRLCGKNGDVFGAKMTVSLVRGNDRRPNYCISIVERLSQEFELPLSPEA